MLKIKDRRSRKKLLREVGHLEDLLGAYRENSRNQNHKIEDLISDAKLHNRVRIGIDLCILCGLVLYRYLIVL